MGDTEFNEWREEVKKQLPQLVIDFYQAKLHGKHIPYEKEVLLGRLIEGINNPFHNVCDSMGNLYNTMRVIGSEASLRVIADDIFEFVNTQLK